jgi:hypothetical protein
MPSILTILWIKTTKMAAFLRLTRLWEDKDGYTQEGIFWASKYYITEIDHDAHHSQTVIKYNGQELRIKETPQELNKLSQE